MLGYSFQPFLVGDLGLLQDLCQQVGIYILLMGIGYSKLGLSSEHEQAYSTTRTDSSLIVGTLIIAPSIAGIV